MQEKNETRSLLEELQSSKQELETQVREEMLMQAFTGEVSLLKKQCLVVGTINIFIVFSLRNQGKRTPSTKKI